jgi:hypothetical protein
MRTSRLYIYCIIELDESKWGQKRNYGEEISFGAIGIDKEEVTTVSFNDIAAVVSKTDVDQFDEDGEETLKQYLARHQQVIEFIMQKHPVIPMKFGIAAENKNDVLEMLDRVYIQFKSAFNKFRDKVELAVQVFWDEQTALQEIVAINKEIQRLMAQANDGLSACDGGSRSNRAKPQAGLQAKITIGKAVHAAVTKKQEAITTDIQNYLLPHAVDFASNKLLTDDMIMNGAFLVEKQREAAFDDRVNEISDKYNGKLKFKYIGPMPPYSFVNIELTMPKFELIDGARRTLGLGEEANMSEIKAAYRKLAAEYHPDKSPLPPFFKRGDFGKGGKFPDEDGERFKKIAEAYEILEIYCENYRYSFRKEQVEGTVFVISNGTNHKSQIAIHQRL